MIDCIRIGPVIYRVVEADDDHMIGASSDGSGKAVRLNGDIMYHSLLIRVNVTSAPEAKVITLWHEAIHGLLHNAGQDQDEGVVSALGFGIIGLIRDNPQLVEMTRRAGSDGV